MRTEQAVTFRLLAAKAANQFSPNFFRNPCETPQFFQGHP
jgi:hypothetical protein